MKMIQITESHDQRKRNMLGNECAGNPRAIVLQIMYVNGMDSLCCVTVCSVGMILVL